MDKTLEQLRRKSHKSLEAKLNYANYLMRLGFPIKSPKDFTKKYLLAMSWNPKYPKENTLLLADINYKEGKLQISFQEILPVYGYETFNRWWYENNPNLHAEALDMAYTYLLDEGYDEEEFDLEEMAYHYVDPLHGFANNFIDYTVGPLSDRAGGTERWFFEDVQEHPQFQDFLKQKKWEIIEELIDPEFFNYLVLLAKLYNNKEIPVYIPDKEQNMQEELIEAIRLGV